MKFFKRLITNLRDITLVILLIVLFFASLIMAFGGAVVILITLLDMLYDGTFMVIKNIGILKSIIFVLIYLMSLAFLLTINEFQSGDEND